MTQPLPTRLFLTATLASLAALCGLAAPVAAPAAAAESRSEPADRTSYVLLSAGGRSSTMSGTMEDLSRAKALRTGSEALLYVRQGGSSYVVRDAAILRRAETIFEPQRALGAKQGALGKRQAALGRDQARLGRRQANAPNDDTAELGRRQAELGRQQAALGREQAELGREQSRLGREAESKLRVVIAEAIRSGAAQRVK